jgi:hypothetical protein
LCFPLDARCSPHETTPTARPTLGRPSRFLGPWEGGGTARGCRYRQLVAIRSNACEAILCELDGKAGACKPEERTSDNQHFCSACGWPRVPAQAAAGFLSSAGHFVAFRGPSLCNLARCCQSSSVGGSADSSTFGAVTEAFRPLQRTLATPQRPASSWRSRTSSTVLHSAYTPHGWSWRWIPQRHCLVPALGPISKSDPRSRPLSPPPASEVGEPRQLEKLRSKGRDEAPRAADSQSSCSQRSRSGKSH